MNGGGQLKAEVQLSTDMIGRKPTCQRVTHHPIPGERGWERGRERMGERERDNGREGDEGEGKEREKSSQ